MISLGIAKQAGTWDESNVCSPHIRKKMLLICGSSMAWLWSKFQSTFNVPLLRCPSWLCNLILQESVGNNWHSCNRAIRCCVFQEGCTSSHYFWLKDLCVSSQMYVHCVLWHPRKWSVCQRCQLRGVDSNKMVNKACNSVKDVIEFLYIEVRTSAAVNMGSYMLL